MLGRAQSDFTKFHNRFLEHPKKEGGFMEHPTGYFICECFLENQIAPNLCFNKWRVVQFN